MTPEDRLKILNTHLLRIFDTHATFLGQHQTPTPSQVLPLPDYMALLVVIRDGDCPESFIKQCFERLSALTQNIIQQSYIPYFQAVFAAEATTDTYLPKIEAYVFATDNFRALNTYLAKFYAQFNKKTFQKMAHLDKPSFDLMDELFAAHVVARFRPQLRSLAWHLFSHNLDREVPPETAAIFRGYLKSLTEFAAVRLTHNDKLKSEIDGDIRKVYEHRTKAALQQNLSLPLPDFLREAAVFKSQVRRNTALFIEEVTELAGLRPSILSEINRNLLDPIIARLNEKDFQEIGGIMDAKHTDSLRNIFTLFLDCEEKIEHFKDFFTRFISRKGTAILATPAPDHREVDAFVTFLLEVEATINVHFLNNKHLRWAVNKATENVMTTLGASKSRTQNEAFANRVFETLLRKFMRREGASPALAKFADLVSYLSVDFFRRTVVAYLTKTVLNLAYLNTNFEPELAMLDVFRQKMGDECCASLIGLLHEMHDFETNKLAKWNAFKENLGLPALTQTALNLTLVSRNTHHPQFDLAIPREFKFFAKAILDFFEHHLATQNQELAVDLTYGYAEVEVAWGGGRCVVAGSPVYPTLLMHLADHKQMTLAELAALIDSQKSPKAVDSQKEVQMYMNQLLEKGLVLKTLTHYVLNQSFFDRDRGIISLQQHERQEEAPAPEAEEKMERDNEIESKIMRLVKQRPHSRDELRGILEESISHFDRDAFRSSLQHLIRSDFVETTGVHQELIKFK